MKKLLLVGLATITALTLAACGNSESASTDDSGESKGNKQLVVSTFALSEDIVRRDIIEPFEKQENASLTLDLGNSADRFTKLVNNPNEAIDVIELSQNNATQGHTDGLFETI
ncbi:MAG: ABC transporter substrate-binding protein, partial [Streptococcaceae bacterium]|nr:ABC transporter substrate-binding protein [Streptococcaceae bacterium]